MLASQLAEIRARAAEVDGGDGSPMPFVSVAEKDRHALLAYIDEIDTELVGVSDRLRELLGAQRILLGIRILEDGHAKNLGTAIRIAEDLDQVVLLYPDVET